MVRYHSASTAQKVEERLKNLDSKQNHESLLELRTEMIQTCHAGHRAFNAKQVLKTSRICPSKGFKGAE